MKNIINVDFQNTINSGMYCIANDTNTLDLCLTPSLVQKTNYRVEVTDTNNIVHTSKAIGLNANDQIKYQVSNAYYNGNGVMKIRLLSNESNSDYIIFNCVEFTTEDLICKYANDQYNFSVKKVNPLELPIATKEKLGAVIVGDGLEVDTAGKITANGGVSNTLNIGENFSGYTDGEGYIILCIPHVVQWYEANGKPSKVVVSGGGNFNLIYDGQTNKGSYIVVPVNIGTKESIATQISQGYLRIKPNWTIGGSSSWKRYLISGYTTKNIILTVN